MKNNVELICSYWTNAGVMAGEAEISRFDFADRVEACAKAGFKGLGIWHTDLEHIMVHRSLKEMKGILDANGVYLELEFLTDWFVEGSRKADSDSRKKRMLAAAEALRVRDIKVGDFYNLPCELPRVAEAFASLCREFGDCGALVGFEFMGCAMLNTLADALAMVRMAGARNGGLVLDIVHTVILDISHEEVARIPAECLVNVELNDGTFPGSPRHDPDVTRRFCGEGEYDIKGFIDSVRKTGYAGPWGVEVYSKELTALPVMEVSERAYRTTQAQFN